MRFLPVILFALTFCACKSWGKFWQTDISYGQNTLVLTQHVTMSPVTPTMPGEARSCMATPALPSGLQLASDCTISGTPARGQGTLPYHISADVGASAVSSEIRIRVLFQPRFVYVANVADSNLTAFSVNTATGALSTLGTYGSGTGTRFVLRDMSGRFLYAANTSAASIAAFLIDQATGALSIVSGSPFATSNNPYSLATDPEGKFLYVGHENAGVAAISAYTINSSTGGLTAVSGSPFAAPAAISTPVSVYVSPDGKNLYAGSTQSSPNQNTFGYAINQQTGALVQLPGSPFGTLQNGISVFVHPSGSYVYYAQYSGNNALGYLRDTVTGTLALMASPSFGAGAAPGFITGDMQGRFIYVANSGDAVGNVGLHGYSVGAGGTLAAIPGSPFTTGKNPIGIACDETGRFIYVVGSGETNPTPDPVYAYQINAQTGAVSFVGTQTAGVDATGIAIAGSNQ